MKWMRVKEGLPQEPNPSDYDEVCSLPGPFSFFQRLFLLLSNVGINTPGTVTETEITPMAEEEVTKGFYGREDIGLRFTARRSLETSLFGMWVSYETYGLPGIQVQWRFNLGKAGQLGYAAFSHESLEVGFQEEQDRVRFEEIWREVFGKKSVYEPLTQSYFSDHDG
jgi:hypothetical protein